MKKFLGHSVTSYDLIKCVALLLMTIDHIGYFIYPDITWLRAVGRGCLPIWFGLIGYATTREIAPSLWIGGAIIVATNILLGLYILPLNILFTMLVLRLILDHVVQIYFKDTSSMMFGMVVFVLVGVPTNVLVEYGTLAIPMMLYGYAARHRATMEINPLALSSFFVLTPVIFGAVNAAMFGFSWNDMAICLATVGAASLLILLFRPAQYEKLTALLTPPLANLIMLCGRNTLILYVVQIVLFKWYTAYKDDTIAWFQPTLFIPAKLP